MGLTVKQKGVRCGMIITNTITILVLISSILINSLHHEDNHLDLMNKVAVVFKSLVSPGICLALSIASLAKYRFFH